MGQFVQEKAHKQYIGNKKYQDNWEHIFGNKKENNEESKQEEVTDKEEDNVRSKDTSNTAK